MKNTKSYIKLKNDNIKRDIIEGDFKDYFAKTNYKFVEKCDRNKIYENVKYVTDGNTEFIYIKSVIYKKCKEKNKIYREPIKTPNIHSLKRFKYFMDEHNINSIDDIDKLILEENENQIPFVEFVVYEEGITIKELKKIKKKCQCDYCLSPLYSKVFYPPKSIKILGCLHGKEPSINVVHKTRVFINKNK